MNEEINKTLETGPIEEEVKQTNWLDEETRIIQENRFDGELLPALKLEEGKITEFEVDFSEPFRKWVGEDGVIKKIIPVTHKGEKMVLWMNVKNPTYSEIITRGKGGQTIFKILRTGQQKNTRYTLVKE